jgi:hypothetical protein
MKLPDSSKVRNAFSNVEKNFDSSISFVSIEKSPTFSEHNNRLQSVVMELTQIFGEIQPLTPTKPARGDIGLLHQKEKVAHDKSHRAHALVDADFLQQAHQKK